MGDGAALVVPLHLTRREQAQEQPCQLRPDLDRRRRQPVKLVLRGRRYLIVMLVVGVQARPRYPGHRIQLRSGDAPLDRSQLMGHQLGRGRLHPPQDGREHLRHRRQGCHGAACVGLRSGRILGFVEYIYIAHMFSFDWI